MIKYVKKLIKKQRLLKKYFKGEKQFRDQLWLENYFKNQKQSLHYFEHQFHCEIRCYNRLKKL